MAATQPASRTAPDAERMFAQHMSAETGEVASSYVAMVSHPQVVVGLIDAAAQATAGYRPRRERRPDRRRARSTSGGSV